MAARARAAANGEFNHDIVRSAAGGIAVRFWAVVYGVVPLLKTISALGVSMSRCCRAREIRRSVVFDFHRQFCLSVYAWLEVVGNVGVDGYDGPFSAANVVSH